MDEAVVYVVDAGSEVEAHRHELVDVALKRVVDAGSARPFAHLIGCVRR